MFRPTAALFPGGLGVWPDYTDYDLPTGLAVAAVKLDGQRSVQMLINTGGGSCLLRPEFARALKLTPEYRVTEITREERVVTGAKSVPVEAAGRV